MDEELFEEVDPTPAIISSEPVYAIGENVLCFDGSNRYEAKVDDLELRGAEYYYFIHYRNWNKS